MKDEIKEILNIERYSNKDGYIENISLTPYEIHKLLDYITNLQESDNDKQLEIMKLKDKLEQQRKEYQETYKDVRIEIKEKDKEIERLNNIINELEKYIRSNEWGIDYGHSNCRTHLLDILKGSE